MLTRLAITLPVVGAIGVLLAALAGVAVARTGLRPVDRLTAATERIATTGDLHPIPVDGTDELARLTRSFNAMLGALAASQEQQRRLVADAGHELRTPLTSMRTNLELLAAANRPGAPRCPSPSARRSSRTSRRRSPSCRRWSATWSSWPATTRRRSCTSRSSSPTSILRALERARRRAGDVEFVPMLVPWTLIGDSTALERAVLNLLDNAAKWSPPHGLVRVQMRQLDEWSMRARGRRRRARASRRQDLPHVFDRFYRADTSRTMPGSGLGLAIVRQVALRHGGAVWAGRAPEGGALMVLRLPGRRPPSGA